MRLKLCILGVVIALLDPSTAFAQTERFALQSNLDHVWTMTAAALVFLMQAGFLLLEAGSVRSKNSINVAQKNMIDFMISVLCFGLIGFALMFGQSVGGFFGFDSSIAFFNRGEDDWPVTFFVFQLMFCGTAATIVSGAVAERATMKGYILLTTLLGVLIYPVAGHWSWGGLLTGSEEPWLASMGFMDFAGSTVVHGVGAWVALAYCIQLGPRKGRYDQEGNPVILHGHSPILSTVGAIIIILGWIGFNGGSTLAGSSVFAAIIANTFLAAAAGALTQLVLGYARRGIQRPENLINGALAGLVAITAGCDVLSGAASVFVGALGALTYDRVRWVLTNPMKVDDPLGAISVHGAAGVVGTIGIALLAPSDTLLAGSRLDQLLVQVTGVAAYFVWAFGIAYAALFLVNRFAGNPDGPGRGLRVPEEYEDIGLNVAEHGAPLGMSGLVDGMKAVLDNPGQAAPELQIEFGEEGYEAAMLFNQIARQIREKHDEAQAKSRETARTSAALLNKLGDTIEQIKTGDLTTRLDGSDFSGSFAALPDTMNAMIEVMSDLVADVRSSTDLVGTTSLQLLDNSQALLKRTEAQSGQLGQLTSEINLLRNDTRDTNEKVQSALEEAVSMHQTVNEVSVVFEESLDRMNRSADATSRIAAALSNIDEIAFKTRLLSLNASVEAARADGESMSGFSVIASEVRSLADQTTHTAETIRELVEDVRTESDAAASTADTANTAFSQVLEQIDGLSANMKIVGETQAQVAETMSSVEQELGHLNSMSQETGADATNTQAAAQLLDHRARQSQEMLAGFTTGFEKKAA